MGKVEDKTETDYWEQLKVTREKAKEHRDIEIRSYTDHTGKDSVQEITIDDLSQDEVTLTMIAQWVTDHGLTFDDVTISGFYGEPTVMQWRKENRK